MGNIDLKKKTGLPIHFKLGTIQSKEFKFQKVIQYSLEDIRNHLINKDITCPNCFYSKYISFDHENFFKEKNIRLNYYLLSPGVAGIEYIKTHAYILKSYPKIIEVAHGSGIIIMEDSTEERVYLGRVKEGNKLIIPPGFKISIINIKLSSPLIVSEIHSSLARNFKIDDETDDLPYFVICKNSKPAIVKNPAFLYVDKYYRIRADQQSSKYNLSAKMPAVKQLLRKYEKFNWLFEKNINIDF